jgi:hypothetical protein
MRLGVFSALISCAGLLSCTIHLPSVAPSQRPTGKEAIVYGRFQVTSSPPFTMGEPHSSIAIVMRCEDGREYRIRFDDEEPIVVLAAAPSTCQLQELLYLDSDNNTLGRTPFPAELIDDMRLEAGRAYYLGDFRGVVSFEFLPTFTTNFRVDDWRNEFTKTTREFREQFPNLRGTETISQLREAEHPEQPYAPAQASDDFLSPFDK